MQKRVAIACTEPPRNLASWSGIPFHLCQALEQAGTEVVEVTTKSAPFPFYYRYLRPLFWRLGAGWFLDDVEPRVLRSRAAVLDRALIRHPVDALLSIHADPIAYSRSTVPSILVHDATFANLVDYYPCFTNLSRRSVRLGHRAYANALAEVSAAVFSSEWAAQSAVEHYGMPPERVHVIEFGANLASPPSRQEVDQWINARTEAAEMHLLLVGVDWSRKGGDLAIRIVDALRQKNIPAVLDIAGCEAPPAVTGHPHLRQHGFLQKDVPREQAVMNALFQTAYYLVVPSQAECYGCVYCEANAFGLPAIGVDTGGVSQVIKSAINGDLLDVQGKNFSQVVAQLSQNWLKKDQYKILAHSSRMEFETRLNWNRFAERLLRIIDQLPSVNHSVPLRREKIV